MELHQLQYVLEIAKHRHFTRAAEEICVAQSSLSQQITKLEEELGTKLFDRTTRSVTPTPAGEEFIQYAKRILADIDSLKQSVQAHIGLEKGRVAIGAITTLETIDFVSLVAQFHKTYPGLHLTIVSSVSNKLMDLLKTSAIDMAIMTPSLDVRNEDFDVYSLGEDEFVLIAAEGNPLLQKGSVDLAGLRDEKFIFPTSDQSSFTIYTQACTAAGFSPHIVCQSGHAKTTLALVAIGMGISFFPLNTFLAAKPAGISYTRLTNPVKKQISLVVPKRCFYPPPVLAFRDYVLRWIKG